MTIEEIRREAQRGISLPRYSEITSRACVKAMQAHKEKSKRWWMKMLDKIERKLEWQS